MHKSLLKSILGGPWQCLSKNGLQQTVSDDRRRKWFSAHAMKGHCQLPERDTNVVAPLGSSGGVAETLKLIIGIN